MKLSIITINLNHCKGLDKTIKSVVAQNYQNFEYIVIDGGSDDDSLSIINQHKSNLAYWISEPDKGIYNAMNKGIAQAKGEYCLFLNSGDWLAENGLEHCIKLLGNEDIIYCNSYLAYSNGSIEELSYPSSLSMRYFFSATIGHQSTFIRKSLLNTYGGYVEQFKIHADYDFWMKAIVMANSTVKHLPIFLSYYDMSGISSRPNQWSQQEHESILNTYLPKKVLADYEYWKNREKEIEILMWYKRQDILYRVLVFLYKVIKNFRKYFKMNS